MTTSFIKVFLSGKRLQSNALADRECSMESTPSTISSVQSATSHRFAKESYEEEKMSKLIGERKNVNKISCTTP
ncbi:hypothetical protein P5673_015952 [Acropora cervicornis]|uniref:Uncharacterized protein n=1 Tax=Acropora cervicornis TaxID=6130 RepID=A0AAD9QHU6_ACRCE|nr:hypothetical protein P5673_015952 [Acropora cervicornis]